MDDLRIGHGIDVHPFQEGRRCVLGGVEIPGSKGLQGHSDADVLVHALIDAILGALGKRDIGTLFPDTDMRFKDADSCKLLGEVWGLAKRDGWSLVNADMTVLAEVPKLKPHITAMTEKLSAILECSRERLAIKATTTERLGFIGREEGIVASAVVLMRKAS